MSDPVSKTTGLTPRELKLLGAAESVLCRWALVKTSQGKLGDCGMSGALQDLDDACEAYPEIDSE